MLRISGGIAQRRMRRWRMARRAAISEAAGGKSLAAGGAAAAKKTGHCNAGSVAGVAVARAKNGMRRWRKIGGGISRGASVIGEIMKS